MWQIAKDNAIEKLEGAVLLLEHRFNSGAHESAFFAIEIALKAYMIRREPKLAGIKSRKEARSAGVRDESVINAFFSHDLNLILDNCPNPSIDTSLRWSGILRKNLST
jgi:hypothetical protein